MFEDSHCTFFLGKMFIILHKTLIRNTIIRPYKTLLLHPFGSAQETRVVYAERLPTASFRFAHLYQVRATLESLTSVGAELVICTKAGGLCVEVSQLT